MAIQMVLATEQHHLCGALRGQTTATRTGEGENEMHYTAEFRTHPPPPPPPPNTPFHPTPTPLTNTNWRNAWWKCLRSCLFLLCVRLWSRTWTFQFLMVVAVGDVFKVYPRDKNSTAFGGAELVDIPVPRGGGVHGLRSDQVSTASSSHSPGAADEAFKWFSNFSPK